MEGRADGLVGCKVGSIIRRCAASAWPCVHERMNARQRTVGSPPLLLLSETW